MNKQTIKLFSSKKSDEWGTPPELFNELNKEFNFTLDAAASNNNAKCSNYFSIENDALNNKWSGRVFCNPPYSKIRKFLKKAKDELSNCELIVFLTFANTDTNWFHEYVLNKAEIRFIKGRLKFTGYDTKGHPAMRPSILVIFRNNQNDKAKEETKAS